MKNNERYDLSERLIHFCRNLDLSDGSAPHVPEEWGEACLAEDTKLSALFLLRVVIRHGYLWATWSLRNRVRTIYGPRPAICFTEMPTAAFLEASVSRQKVGQKISTFALTFLKSQLFDLGARPVIYGLSDSSVSIPSVPEGEPRIIPVEALPLIEQYRYVSYFPTGPRRVDWTHEREWRWPFAGSLAGCDAQLEEYVVVSNVQDLPGLNLYHSQLTDIGVIVTTDAEAQMVLHDILTLVDRQQIRPDTFGYILVSDKIGAPDTIRDRDSEKAAIAAVAIDLTEFLAPQPTRDNQLALHLDCIAQLIEARAGEPVPGEPGGCWLWLADIVHPLTRALLNKGRVIINRDGKYLVPIDEFDGRRGLRQREEMTEELARRMHEEHGIEAGRFSVLASNNPDAVPYYNSDHLDNRLHYNWAHVGLD